MTIQEKLNSLRPYVTGIRYVENVPVVDANLKNSWSLLKSDDIKRVQDEKNPHYFVFLPAKEGLEIDDVLNYVEKVINYNIENEKKQHLFQDKIEELKEVFKQNSLEDLKTLKFSIGGVSDENDLLNDKDLVEKEYDLVGTEQNGDVEEQKKEDNSKKEETKKNGETSKQESTSNGKQKSNKGKQNKKKETQKVSDGSVELPDKEEVEGCQCDHSKGEYCELCQHEVGL